MHAKAPHQSQVIVVVYPDKLDFILEVLRQFSVLVKEGLCELVLSRVDEGNKHRNHVAKGVLI